MRGVLILQTKFELWVVFESTITKTMKAIIQRVRYGKVIGKTPKLDQLVWMHEVIMFFNHFQLITKRSVLLDLEFVFYWVYPRRIQNKILITCTERFFQTSITRGFNSSVFKTLSRVRKILNLRVFEDETGKRWMKSVTDLKREVLCISQFTLCHTLKGNKPDFRSAMATDESRAMYEQFLAQMCKNYEATLVKSMIHF